MKNFVAIGLGVSAPQIRDSAVPFDVTIVFTFVFFGFFNKAMQPTPLNGFLRKIRQNDIVPGKEVPFGGLDNYIIYLDILISEKPQFLGPILTEFFMPNIASTWGCSNLNYP